MAKRYIRRLGQMIKGDEVFAPTEAFIQCTTLIQFWIVGLNECTTESATKTTAPYLEYSLINFETNRFGHFSSLTL